MSKKSGAEVAQTKLPKSSLPRTHKDYWKQKVFKRTYRNRDGNLAEVTEFCARMQFQGRREEFPLGSANASLASEKARDIYLSLQAVGWEGTLRKFKLQSGKPSDQVTVGEFIELVHDVIDVARGTWRNYPKCLRQIVADLRGLDRDDTAKYDAAGGKCYKWRERVDGTKLAFLTRPRIERWRKEYVERAGNPEESRRARTSANTVLRNASAMFRPELLEKLGIKVENPFAGIKPFKAATKRYRSNFDASALLRAAQEAWMRPQGELEFPEEYERRTEAFKALVVFAFTGIRRRELDLLLWSQVNLREGYLEITRTPYFEPKSEGSIRRVPLDEDAVQILQGFRARSPQAKFVMNGAEPRPATYSFYRAEQTFSLLIAWLRDYSPEADDPNVLPEHRTYPLRDAQKPLHRLRKEVGAILATKFGIFAAQSVLGHSSIALTASYYADQKERVSVGLSLSK